MVTPSLARLQAEVDRFDRVVVAFSGGVDSSVVLAVAYRALGDRCSALIARSASLPAGELEAAMEVAGFVGAQLGAIDTHELEVDGYVANGADRCYFCKTEVYGAIARVAGPLGATIFDGFNRDDRRDTRPGRRAAAEHRVVSPLDEAGLGKAEVREIARDLGLPNWDKPEAACLSSRIPTGVPVSIEALERVDAAERRLRAEGFRQVRVRDHHPRAVIEVGRDQLARLTDEAFLDRVRLSLLELGYSDVQIDGRGYQRRLWAAS